MLSVGAVGVLSGSDTLSTLMTLSRGDQQDFTGGYAAAPLLPRDHAGSGGRLGSAAGGASAGGGGGTDGGGHPDPDAVGI